MRLLILSMLIMSCQQEEADKRGARNVQYTEHDAEVSEPQAISTEVNVSNAPLTVCANGGLVIEKWKDANHNGVYDQGEPDYQVAPVCNGEKGDQGIAGEKGLSQGLRSYPASLSACVAGGSVIETWSDLNHNGNIDENEPNYQKSTLCNGAAGRDGISWGISVMSATANQCAAGGVAINLWRDLNSNAVYDMGDTNFTQSLVCNSASGTAGSTGATGAQGYSAQIKVRVATISECENGGKVFETWIDQNNDGVYQTGEPNHNLTAVCNPAGAAQVGVRQIAATAASCENGGTIVETWTETSGNAIPDLATEIATLKQSPICNAKATVSQSIKVSQATTECAEQGQIIETWADVNNNGVYDNATDTNYKKSTLCTGSSAETKPPMIFIATGALHRCAILEDHTVSCWGRNGGLGALGLNLESDYYQLKPNADRVRVYPDLQILSDVTQLAMGRAFGCAVSNSEIYCWGENTYGQLGIGTNANSLIARKVSGIANAIEVQTGGHHACARLSDGNLKCWGYNAYGQLGNGQTSNNSFPQLVANINGQAIQLSVGGHTTCALLANKKVYCWGYNGYGQLGLGNFPNSSTCDTNPRSNLSSPVGVISDVKFVSAGMAHGNDNVCALLENGSIYCWGRGEYGQNGNGVNTHACQPVRVISDQGELTNMVSVNASGGHNCAISSDHKLYCWGYGGYGQLGIGVDESRPVATKVKNPTGTGDFTEVEQVSCGGNVDGNWYGNCAAILTNGQAFAWGYNGYGALGINTTTSRNLPVGIPYP